MCFVFIQQLWGLWVIRRFSRENEVCGWDKADIFLPHMAVLVVWWALTHLLMPFEKVSLLPVYHIPTWKVYSENVLRN